MMALCRGFVGVAVEYLESFCAVSLDIGKRVGARPGPCVGGLLYRSRAGCSRPQRSQDSRFLREALFAIRPISRLLHPAQRAT